MIGIVGPLALALCMGAPQHHPLKKEVWKSPVGYYRITVPVNWSLMHKFTEQFEDVRLQPKSEPTVSLTILTRRTDRPMTSIHNDRHLRSILTDYKKRFQDVIVEKGPNRVPVGNVDSWSYLILYNTKALDGSKISVRESISYVNRRAGDLAYLHHILIGRVPLPVAKEYSPALSETFNKIDFFEPDLNAGTASPAPSASPGASPGATPGGEPSAAPSGEPAAVPSAEPAVGPSAEPAATPAPERKKKGSSDE